MIRKFVFLASIFFFIAACSPLRFVPEDQVAIPVFMPKKPVELALVLGGGGSKGLAHLGAILELEKAGIRPDLIIGCSAGAIAGALYAKQPNLEGAAEALLPLRKEDVLDYSFSPIFGLVQGESLLNLLKKLLHEKTFEELEIPLIVVATDLISGDVLEFSSGDLAEAIHASCAVPGVFKPVSLYGRHSFPKSIRAIFWV
jgi:NTE family protein